MVSYAAFLIVGGRSETVRILHGEPADERYRGFAVKALAFSGLLTPLVLLAVGLLEIASGGDGQPYALVCLLSGVNFAAALLWLQWRS